MASHDAGLDVLVGDLLVVVGAAAGRVHGRRCHGVEREDELLSVTHAGRLRVIPRDALQLSRGVVTVLVQIRLVQGVRGEAAGQGVGRGDRKSVV